MKKNSSIMSLFVLAVLSSCSQQSNLPEAIKADSLDATATSSRSLTTQALDQSYTRLPFGQNGKLSWDWQIGANNNQISPPSGIRLIDIDGFKTQATMVAKLKQNGIYTVCYINVGSWEPYRPDAAQFPDRLKVQIDPDWPDEYFLDIKDVLKDPQNSVYAKLLRARFAMCKAKGFQALEPDNLQNFENIKKSNPRRPSKQQQVDFNAWVADEAHKAGLAVLQKNGPDLILERESKGARRQLVEIFDGILNEQCQENDECEALAEYPKRGKLALNVEYELDPDCSLSDELAINTLFRDLDLRAPGMAEHVRTSCD